ncbi:hypothetical protein VP1G_05415 [Cytospora mali]|uniref:PhoD-like phosphatase domain-containing protein n=1 Tax=Cytospora mali TaxID=578113 RepID=A0A194V2G9_CYTMA|nr:hypothetical protein VP1G_05415 [Valsa mali var. pyri (nom. inval.)]
MSPYASPTASSFQAPGLTPRPPSLPYGQSQYSPEILEKRRRRASKNREEDYAYFTAAAAAAAAAPPPAAPDVPKAPPSSFRHPYGNGGLPYTYQKEAPQQPDVPLSPGAMDPEYYQPLGADQPKRSNTVGSQSPSRRITSDSAVAPTRNGSSRGSVNGNRKASLPIEGDGRLFADARSPLQQLELTLDSITKEEKRARIAAAEQRARERMSRGSTDMTQQSAVRFNDKAIEAEPESPAVQVLPDPLPAQPSVAPRRASVGQEIAQQRTSQPGISLTPKTPVSKFAQDTGISQRNLSFRERAARKDMKLLNGGGPDDSSTTPPATTPTSYSVSRNGSNKLTKEPTGDPWYQQRVEAEKKYAQVSAHQQRGPTHPPAEAPGIAAASASAGPTPPSKTAGGSVRNKVPPVDFAVETRRPPGRYSTSTNDLDSPSIAPSTAGLGVSVPSHRRGSAADQVPTPTSIRSAPGTRQNAAETGAVSKEAIARSAAATSTAEELAGRQQHDGNKSDKDDTSDKEHHFREYFHRHEYKPGQGMYNPPKFLDEWRKGSIGILSGTMLDLSGDTTPTMDKGPSSQRRGSISTRPRKAEAFDGEYDETNAPTRFKPPLYLKCGPLLRYCGIRTERIPSRSPRIGPAIEREFWRGTVMIVTQDQDSSYDIAPTLRLFAQPIELLPPPPPEVHGEIPPEFVDPIAGHPKLGRKGETLYVRPVDHLDESKDVSRDETGEGLFEKTRSPPDIPSPDGSTDAPGSFAARRKRTPVDGEKVGKYKDVRGYRLHAERGYTFWRFSIEIELRDKEQRIAYRINRGPATGFWVPAKGQSMNIMFHSCNGFSLSVNPDQLSGPDPMWRDVLNSHQSRPFHVMLGGGDQLYCDAVMKETNLFQEWLMIRNPVHKHNAPFTPEMQDELEAFYLERYCMWFSQGLFGLANSQIPMVNMYDDHDIIDGFGSYPHHFMNSPVFSGLGNVAFKYYMLFQHQSITDETEETEPSWALGAKPGPYIQEQSRSLFMNLGSKIALLAVDCRTERKRDQVVRDETWAMLMDRCYSEIVKGKTEHLLVLLGVPIAYPRLVWLENILTSRLLDPIKALGKTGLFGNVFNKFDGGVEVLDDLDDHWTAKSHKDERRIVLEDLQDLAADRSVRITILSGDVHLAAVGQFYSNPKLELAKHKDFRYMPNIISSAIVNTPPPDLMADVLNKRNKVHHLDKDTDEDMIPMFAHGVEGKPRNNKRLLPHRNWCSIREYTPGQTPPPTPPESLHEGQWPLDSPDRQDNGFAQKGTTRRLSKRNRGPVYRSDVIDSRPPISGSRRGRFFRSLSWRKRSSTPDVRTQKPPSRLRRTLSLSRVDLSGFIRRMSKSRSRRKVNDGGIDGPFGGSDPEVYGYARRREEEYDLDYEDDSYDQRNRGHGFLGGIGLRGGGGPGGGGSYEEFSEGDESYFTTRAPQATGVHNGSASKAMKLLGDEVPRGGYGTQPPQQQPQYQQAPPLGVTTKITGPDEHGQDTFRPKPFHRTPTDMSVKKAHKRTKSFDVNIEGGLDICLNVEVSPKDPAGITVPYRLLVPKLWYDPRDGEEVELPERGREKSRDRGPGTVKRFFSLSRTRSAKGTRGEGVARGQRDQRGQEGPELVASVPGAGGNPAPGTAI